MQFEDLKLKERQAYVKHRTQANMHRLQSKKAKGSRSKFHLNMAQFHKDAMCELLKLVEADAITEKLRSAGEPPKPDPMATWFDYSNNIFSVTRQVVNAPTRILHAKWSVSPMRCIDIEAGGLEDIAWLYRT